MARRITKTQPETENAHGFFRQNARYFLALALSLLVLQDVFGAHGLIAMHRSKIKLQQVQAQIEKLNQENQDLQQRIHRLKTDPSAIEKIARDRMGLARPGELIFRMPSLKDAPKNPRPPKP